jgi:hypothetical protein
MSTFADGLPSWQKDQGMEAGLPQEQKATSTTGGSGRQDPVVVWEASNPMEAQVVKGRLESEGIPAFLRGEALGTIYGLTTGGLAMTEVLVPAPLAEKALDILHTEVDWPDDSEVEGGSGEAST